MGETPYFISKRTVFYPESRAVIWDQACRYPGSFSGKVLEVKKFRQPEAELRDIGGDGEGKRSFPDWGLKILSVSTGNTDFAPFRPQIILNTLVQEYIRIA